MIILDTLTPPSATALDSGAGVAVPTDKTYNQRRAPARAHIVASTTSMDGPCISPLRSCSSVPYISNTPAHWALIIVASQHDAVARWKSPLRPTGALLGRCAGCRERAGCSSPCRATLVRWELERLSHGNAPATQLLDYWRWKNPNPRRNRLGRAEDPEQRRPARRLPPVVNVQRA